MNILLISTLGFHITPEARYTGIERLVWEFSRQLVREHQVTVIGLEGSEYPEGVEFLPAEWNEDAILGEVRAYQSYSYLFRQFDVIHDFSHQHLAARLNKLPAVNVFWHAPRLAKYPKAPYNIAAPSRWAAREFKLVYRQEARVQEVIIVDPEKYCLSTRRGERFLTLGRMGPEKGNLNAVILCQQLGLELDVVGGRGLEKSPDAPLTEYEKAIIERCDGKQIRFLGEVDDQTKIELMQTCKALIYITDHPEVTSHKIQEAMFCGAPVIGPNIGALPEIITNGVNGYLCNTPEEYSWAVLNVDKLKPWKVYPEVVERWRPETIVNNYVKLYNEVKEGARW
jgi:glycosyltransferase involved in cell wall biosynthesis